MGDYKKKFLVIKNLLNQRHFLRSIQIFSSNIGHTIYAYISKNISKVQWVEISLNQQTALELHSSYWPQSHRVTDTQGYSVYGWVKFFVPDFNKLPYSLCSQRDNKMSHRVDGWIDGWVDEQVDVKTVLWITYTNHNDKIESK